MPRKKPSTLLAERVTTLLAERKAIRPLLTTYQAYLDAHNYTNERTDLERKIAAIVSSGPPFDEAERLESVPQDYALAEAAFRMRCAFNRPELRDDPALVWDGATLSALMPASWRQVSSWHPALKERLIDLCGPLDGTLERMLSGRYRD